MMKIRTRQSQYADCGFTGGRLSPGVVTRSSKIAQLVAKTHNKVFDFPEKKNGSQSLATRRNYTVYFFSAVLYQLSYLATAIRRKVTHSIAHLKQCQEPAPSCRESSPLSQFTPATLTRQRANRPSYDVAPEKKDASYYHRERAQGSFMRTIELPTHVDAGKILATFRDGVLHVAVPKSKEAKPKEIKVSVN